MSYSKLEKHYREISEIPLKDVVIPFSKLFKINRKSDIYSGTEKIPFKERDPDYKRIFKQEFSKGFISEFKIYRPVVRFPSF
jgi:hypothetical protein